MSANLLDKSTWQTSTLNTAAGPITYWVLADLDAYFEGYEDEGNVSRTLVAVAWKDADDFRRYALGFAEYQSGYTFFNRYTPLQHPFQTDQYLASLKKVRLHPGTTAAGQPIYAAPDPLFNNWWGFFDATATASPPNPFPSRIVYEAVFTNPAYDIVDQDTFRGSGDNREQKRFVIRDEEFRPRERRAPSFGYETDDAAATKIPEVGFIPFYNYEFTYVWCKVPWERRPLTAISTCALKINNAAFDYKLDGTTYGRFLTGDILFKGLAGKIRRYRGPSGEWLVNLPYVFSWQPAGLAYPGDPGGNGWNKIPRIPGNTPSTNFYWVKVRASGSAAAPKPLYESANLETLFQPEPG